MKSRVIYILIVVLAILVGSKSQQRLSKATASTSGQPKPAPTETVDPLTIAAMKVRGYASGPVTLEQTLAEKGGYTASVFSFSSDGLKEYGYWAQPSGLEPAGGWPVIVLVHGYIDPSQYNTVTNAYTSWIAAWARAGFVVVQPDLRGNGQSDGTAVSGHWSPDYTYDIMNLIATLKADTSINPKHIGLVGHSMGGHVALNVADISPAVASTVLVNGVVGSMYDLFYDWPNSPAPNDQPASVVKQELSSLLSNYGSPKTDPSFWNQASAINYVSAIAGPVQIDADSGDTTVPAAFSLALDSALLNAKKNVTLYRYPGDDHQLSIPASSSLFLQRSTAFFQQTL